MKISRDFRCSDLKSCCPFWTCPCCDCGQLVTVADPSGKTIGYIKEDSMNHCCNGGITAYNANDEPIMRVKTNACSVMCTQMPCPGPGCCQDTIFELKETDKEGRPGEDLGVMKRKWKCKGCCADLDDFNTKFIDGKKIDLDTKKIAIAFMIFVKYAWFEEKEDN